MIADLLLRWISVTGSGHIRDLRERVAWAARTCDRSDREPEPGRWLRDLASLGHIELDWDAGRWAAAPLVVTRLPGTDGLAMLAGPRGPLTETCIEDLDLEVHRLGQPGTAGRLDRPTAVLFQYDSAADLRNAAAALRARFVPCAAAQLAAVLPVARLGERAAPPSRGNDTLERFDAAALSWHSEPADAHHADGLYRLTNLGRPQHLSHSGADWRHCTLSDGVFVQLQRTSQSVMRWRPDPGAGRAGYGQLFTDWGAPLPPLHQRSLVLCSGFLPRFPDTARTAVYDNVPRAIAEAVARSLGQQLQLA